MGRDEPLVTIASFADSFEASLAKGALAAVGIEACVPDETFGTFSLNRGRPQGRAVLQVFESDRERATAELNRIERQSAAPSPE